MESGDELEGYYVLKDPCIKMTTSGKQYLTGSLMDKTGTIEFKAWDYSGSIGSADNGKVAKVRGGANEFKGDLQLIIKLIRLAEPNDPYDASELVPAAPIDEGAALLQIRELISSIKDVDYRNIAETMLDRHLSEFRHIPAAKTVHHSFLNGLLMHTWYMMRSADFYAEMYPEIINRSLLLTGTLLHDFAKREEFAFSELGIVTDYSVKGQLIGHLVMGAQDIAELAKEMKIPEEKSILLQHMILSHHGEPEFGAAVRPMCAEAELLSYLDLVDSRMEIYRENLQNMGEGEFSDRIFALEKKIYRPTGK